MRSNPKDSNSITRKEMVLMPIMIFPIFGTLFPLDSYLSFSQAGIAAGGGVTTIVNTTLVLAIMLAVILVLFSMSPGKAVSSVKRNAVILLFILWAFVTSRWAENPGFSFNRTGRMLLCFLYAVYIIENYRLEKAVKLLVYSLIITELISTLMIVAVPSLSQAEDARGAWRGAMSHKNGLGGVAGITLICAVAAIQLNVIRRSRGIAIILLSMVLLVLANSVTAILAVMLIGAVLFYLFAVVMPSKNRIVAVFGGGLLLVGMAGLVSMKDMILGLFGRDSSLTGRSDVWDFASFMIDRNPIWGYGNSAWSGDIFSATVFQYLGWQAPHAHNAWLDFRLQLGLPGLLLGILLWLAAYRNSLILILRGKIKEMAFFFGILLFLTIRSTTETLIVDPATNEMFWFAFCYAGMSKVVSEMRRERRHAASARRIRPPVLAPIDTIDPATELKFKS